MNCSGCGAVIPYWAIACPTCRPELLRCSFCGKHKSVVEKLISSSRGYICVECVRRFHKALEKVPVGEVKRRATCSFCNKPYTEVGQVFGGPTVYICDGCIKSLIDMFSEQIPEVITLRDPVTGTIASCGPF